MADTWVDIISDALIEIGVYQPGDPVPAADMDFCVRRLNRVLDMWAALKRYAYNVTFGAYTLTPAHQPHLIGPGLGAPDFGIASRPVRIEGAALIVNNVDLGINIRDDDWWQRQRVKTLSTAVPTDLFPSYDAPNVALYFWPIPDAAYDVRLETWVSLQQVTDPSVDFVAPQGYNLAVMQTLAEELTIPYGKPMPEGLPRAAARSRAAILSNTSKSPRISSADFATARKLRRGGFNYSSGGPA